MLSVLFGEQSEILKQILNFYLPRGSKILDVTYGHGKLYRLSGNLTLEYEIVSNDVDPESPSQYHLPFNRLFEIVKNHGRFDAVIYDPPYKYDQPSYVFRVIPEQDADWKPLKTKWTIQHQTESATILNDVLPFIIKKNGFLIAKIMDTRKNGKLILNHNILINCLTNFELIDLIVYVRTMMGLFRNDRHSQTAHGYFLIFKNRRKVS